MEIKSDYRQDGYQMGFVEGKRTGGKVTKRYVDNYLNDETQNLCTKDSLEFMKAWQEGFADGVIRLTSNMVKQGGLLKNQNIVIAAEEILRTEIIVNQALIDILIAKQIISEEELVDSIQNIQQEQKKLLNVPNKIVSLKR
jgi:hypothetical protein